MATKSRFRQGLSAVSVLAGLVLAGCGTPAAFEAREWTQPVPLTEIDTEAWHEKAPFLSFDGLTLYFGRQVPGAYTHIWQAVRPTVVSPFAAPTEISALNDPYGHVDYPWVSSDNLRMYYYRTEVGGKRLKLAERASVSAPWGPGADIDELNVLGDVANPSLTQDERIIVFSGYNLAGGKGDWDLWMASRPNRKSRFGHMTNLAALNTEKVDVHPCLTPDGLTLYFASNRQEVFRIFRTTRSSRHSPFKPPQLLAVYDVHDAQTDYPRLSADGGSFFFVRWPKDEPMDLYVSYKVGP